MNGLMKINPDNLLNIINTYENVDDIKETGLYVGPKKNSWEFWAVEQDNDTITTRMFVGFCSFEMGVREMEQWFYEIVYRYSANDSDNFTDYDERVYMKQ
jgi:hypothetical protein